jgi:hypothetical protein
MSNDTLIREVDEELQRDRMRKLWRQLGPFVIAGAVLIVVAVAGYEGWMWWTKSQSAQSSDQFYAAVKVADGTDLDAAKKALDDVIAKGSGGYPMLAQFREAALLAQQGKIDDAVAAYDGLSTSITNPHLRELALILAGSELIDKGDVDAVQQRVGGSITPNSPLRNAAREVLGLAQYKAGKLDDAMKSFADIINDPKAQQDTRSRVQIYALQLVAEGAKPIAPPADPTVSSAPSAEVSSAPASAEVSSAAASTEPSSAAPVVSSEPSTAASSEASIAVSSEASTAVDASTELDVTPPVTVDTSMMSLALPNEESSAPASSDASTVPFTPATLPSSSAP